MFAGSHWLTHLGPGNTPIPTYPWIQLRWHKTVTVKGDSQHRVTYNRWITFCKSKVMRSYIHSTEDEMAQTLWHKEGKCEAVRALVAELRRDRERSKLGDESSRRPAVYKRTHHGCRPSAGGNCSEQKLFFKGNSHTSEGIKANTHGAVQTVAVAVHFVWRGYWSFPPIRQRISSASTYWARGQLLKEDSVSGTKMSAVVPVT